MANGWENLERALDILDALARQIPGLDDVSDSAKVNLISRLYQAQATLWLCKKHVSDADSAGSEMASRCLEAAYQAREALDSAARQCYAQRLLDRVDRLHERAFHLCQELTRQGAAV